MVYTGEIKIVIKIDYKEDGEWQNEELFDDIEKAWEFMEQLKKDGVNVMEATIVAVNKDNLYYEKDGRLNYEDNSLLYA